MSGLPADRSYNYSISCCSFVWAFATAHQRFPDERFLIHDKTHGMALIFEPYRSAIIPIIDLELSEPDEEELAFRELWRQFYETISIKARYNPRGRMGHMPKRY